MLASAAMPLANLAAAALVIAGAIGQARAGGLVMLAGLGWLAGAVVLRASVMVRRSPLADWPKALAVAAAYEAGRALALAGRFGYRRRRRPALA
jgi:hypothetical protein